MIQILPLGFKLYKNLDFEDKSGFWDWVRVVRQKLMSCSQSVLERVEGRGGSWGREEKGDCVVRYLDHVGQLLRLGYS